MAETFALDRGHLLVEPLEALFRSEEAISYRLLGWLRGALEPLRGVQAAYLFGSAVRHEMTKDSDIDLAILGRGVDSAALEDSLQDVVSGLRQRTGSPVQLVISVGDPAKMRGGQRRLWDRILKEGVVIVPGRRGGARRSDGRD